MLNSVVLIGRIARDIELKYLQNGTAMAKFTIAVDKGLSKEKKQEMEGKGQATADFINIVAWGKTAEAVANYSAKGRLIGIVGRITTGSYEKEGRRVYTTEVYANEIDILEWKDKQGFTEVDMQEEIPF